MERTGALQCDSSGFGELGCDGGAEGSHQGVVVAGSGGDHHTARFDALQWHGGQVGA
jgi:hypothetical protein